jgi:mannosyltransferase OCH1-like enzyme
MIPKVFHQIWINDNDPSLPKRFADYRDGWLRLHPGWDYKLWNLNNIDFPLRRPELLKDAGSYAQLADILRLEIISEYGGIYLDTDFECLRSIEPLLDNVSLFFCSEDGETFTQSIFGARPKHPLVLRLVKDLPSTIGRDLPNLETGPRYVTKSIINDGFSADLTVFPRKTFFPYNWAELHRANEAFPDSYAVHRYAASWAKPLSFPQKIMRKMRRIAAAAAG